MGTSGAGETQETDGLAVEKQLDRLTDALDGDISIGLELALGELEGIDAPELSVRLAIRYLRAARRSWLNVTGRLHRVRVDSEVSAHAV